jgi:glycosyltransferase involved in cell wall biosynthesis
MQLVLVGEYRNEVFHTGIEELRAEIERSGVQDQVVFTGFLPDPEVAMLLNLATVLVLPSFMEGYGLPAVEAAACGCPVIATNRSPLASILGAGVLSIEPEISAIGSALATVLHSDSLRNQMREAGLKAARELTWDAAARQMMDVLNVSPVVNSARKEVPVAGN